MSVRSMVGLIENVQGDRREEADQRICPVESRFVLRASGTVARCFRWQNVSEGSTDGHRSPREGRRCRREESKAGTLIVVGTGIRIVGQLTMEAIAWMRKADRLLYLGAILWPKGDPTTEPDGCQSLLPFYEEGRPRILTYNEMVKRILVCVRSGMMTCRGCLWASWCVRLPVPRGHPAGSHRGLSGQMLPRESPRKTVFLPTWESTPPLMVASLSRRPIFS